MFEYHFRRVKLMNYGHKWPYWAQNCLYFTEIGYFCTYFIVESITDPKQNGWRYDKSPNSTADRTYKSRNTKSWITVAWCTRYWLCWIYSNTSTTCFRRNCNSILSRSWWFITSANAIRNQVNINLEIHLLDVWNVIFSNCNLLNFTLRQFIKLGIDMTHFT